MPPTSRGVLLFRAINRTPPPKPQFLCPRHASFKRPTKIPEDLRPQPKRIVPEAGPEVEITPKHRKPPFRARTLYSRFRGNTASRGTVRFLLWLPIIIVLHENFPLAYWPIEGGSMQPTFNPSYTSESGIINTKDHVLVLKQPSSNTFRYLRSLIPTPRRKRADPAPQRGQIVVFITPHDHTKKSVKRVVAIPGDSITPLSGSTSGIAPVKIPYNHVWVEGDVSDVSKSLDSNHFGPLSANLIIGRVLVTLPAFHPWWDGTRWEDASYPARDRVEESAARPLNPDEEDNKLAFRDGRISAALDVVKAYPPARPLTPMERERWQKLYQVAVSEKGEKDIETYELANALEAEMRMKLSGKTITTTLKNVEMSREEFDRFQKEGVVPDAVLKRAEGA